VKENKIGWIVFGLLALITAFGLGYFAGHTADRNTVQISDALLTVSSPQTENEVKSETEQILTGPVNINTADEELLGTLPGIGPGLAARIIEYRNTHGPFQSIEDIKNVEGIGDGRFEEIRYLITTGG